VQSPTPWPLGGSIEGTRLQLFHNRISGGTGAQENDSGAIILKDSTDSVLMATATDVTLTRSDCRMSP